MAAAVPAAFIRSHKVCVAVGWTPCRCGWCETWLQDAGLISQACAVCAEAAMSPKPAAMVATAAPAAAARRRVYVFFISAFGGVEGMGGELRIF